MHLNYKNTLTFIGVWFSLSILLCFGLIIFDVSRPGNEFCFVSCGLDTRLLVRLLLLLCYSSSFLKLHCSLVIFSLYCPWLLIGFPCVVILFYYMFVCVLVRSCLSLLGVFFVWLKESLMRLFVYVLRKVVYLSCWLVCNDAYHLFSLSKLFVA